MVQGSGLPSNRQAQVTAHWQAAGWLCIRLLRRSPGPGSAGRDAFDQVVLRRVVVVGRQVAAVVLAEWRLGRAPVAAVVLDACSPQLHSNATHKYGMTRYSSAHHAWLLKSSSTLPSSTVLAACACCSAHPPRRKHDPGGAPWLLRPPPHS